MPRAGFCRSGGYRRIREGWGEGTAVWPPAVRRGVQTKKGRHLRGRWGAEARRVERCRCFICRPETASHAGVYWEQVGAFADPVQETGWLVDVKVSAPYVVTGQQHKIRKVINAGTRLCFYILGTKNMVVSERYTLKTSNSRPGILKMVSEFALAGIIGAGLPASTILLELVLGDRPDDFFDVLPGFTLKWTQAHANKEVGAYFTLAGIGFQADYPLLDISKINVGPAVELKRLRFMPLDLSSDQSHVALGHLNLSDGGDS